MLPSPSLSPSERLQRILDPVLVLRDAGVTDPHSGQVSCLRNWRTDHMLLWSRQGAKSTTAAALACHNLVFGSHPVVKPTVVITSKAGRQSGELFRKARDMLGKLPYFDTRKLVSDNHDVIETQEGGRILSYPGS